MELNYKERHVSRFLAIMSLYSYGINNDNNVSLKLTSKRILDSYKDQAMFDTEETLELLSPDAEFLDKIITLTSEKDQEVQDMIKSCLIAKWNFEKLDQVIRAVLKLATAELMFNHEVMAKIIIDEYVTLTKSFYENNEAGFVNKVLDTIALKVRQDEMASLS